MIEPIDLMEIHMKKIAALATAMLLAASGTYALAQGTGSGTPGTPGAGQESQRPERPRISQDDFNRFVDARIAGIKAGLRLTGDQERLWQPVENAIRTNAGERFTRFEQRRDRRDQRQSTDFMQRLEQRGTSMTENAQRTTAIATAMRPLWDTFNEDQKRIAPRLLRPVMGGPGWRGERRGGRRDHAMHHGRMGGGMGHHGGGPQGQGQPQNPQ
jgi:hypothetical protein